MNKVAVHCKTSKEWDDVIVRCGLKLDKPCSFVIGVDDFDEIIILIQDQKWIRKHAMDRYQGYTIISAQEYLGGRMFKIGDRVELIKNERWYKCGNKGSVKGINESGWLSVEFDKAREGAWACHGLCQEDKGRFINPEYLKLIKENNMKENNINKNVLEVFGDLSAKEVVIIDRHFTDEMLKVIMMNNHKEEIRRACEDAEEKLKEDID